jgi:serine/threonine protein kinase
LAADAPAGHCPACLFGLAMEVAADGDADAPRPKTTPQAITGVPSRFFGDFELLDEIARGGMGVVYRARQLSLNRLVAVKMILDGPLVARGFIDRFQIEAEATAKLNHPHIVPIYEIGQHEGRHFFSMKLFEGGSLGDRMEDFGLSPRSPAICRDAPGDLQAQAQNRQRDIARLIATVADAVHHAHERGILHRDLKPANILLDAKDQPNVTDFGLAKLVQDDSLVTQTGAFLGTPAYMAPEQVSGETSPLTTAADVYGLGAVLYHLLTGRPPFQATSVVETMRQVVEQPPIPPDRLNPWVNRDLATICLKCLAKAADQRYGSARELAEDLNRWQNGDTILARPATRADHFAHWCRRKPSLAGLSVAVLCLLLAVVGVSITAAFRIDRARQRAVLAERRGREKLWETYLAQARAQRWSGRPGRRFDSLTAITNAAAIRSSVELRNEAIACLSLIDLRPVPGPPLHHDLEAPFTLDWARNRYVTIDSKGTVAFRRLDTGTELSGLPKVAPAAEFPLGFSPDGRWLALTHRDHVTRFWDLERRRVSLAFTNVLEAVAFSPDNQRLTINTQDGETSVYELARPHPAKFFRFPANP